MSQKTTSFDLANCRHESTGFKYGCIVNSHVSHFDKSSWKFYVDSLLKWSTIFCAAKPKPTWLLLRKNVFPGQLFPQNFMAKKTIPKKCDFFTGPSDDTLLETTKGKVPMKRSQNKNRVYDVRSKKSLYQFITRSPPWVLSWPWPFPPPPIFCDNRFSRKSIFRGIC